LLVGDVHHVEVRALPDATEVSFYQKGEQSPSLDLKLSEPRSAGGKLGGAGSRERQLPEIVRLFRRGFIEPIPIAHRAAHLLAHQLLAMTVQVEGGIPVADWWAWVSQATPFQGLDEADRKELVEHMLGEGILAESGGRYSLGERGEKLYGWKNFAELYAVFSAPQILKVLWGVTEIGSIDVTFAQQEKLENLSFVLGARPWRAVAIDFAQGIVRVEPIASGKLARWQGRSGLLGRDLCQAMLENIVSDDAPSEWSRRARDRLAELRTEYRDAGAGSSAIVADTYGLRLWTFGGARPITCSPSASKRGSARRSSSITSMSPSAGRPLPRRPRSARRSPSCAASAARTTPMRCGSPRTEPGAGSRSSRSASRRAWRLRSSPRCSRMPVPHGWRLLMTQQRICQREVAQARGQVRARSTRRWSRLTGRCGCPPGSRRPGTHQDLGQMQMYVNYFDGGARRRGK
jgi:hypothetical protein